MKQTVTHSSLQENSLQIDLGGYFGNTKYFFDGQPVKPHRNVLKVKDKNGGPLEIKIKPGMPDLFPQLVIQGETVKLVESLRWYEYAWILLPLGLVSIGGALGGGLGMFAMLVNARIFRSQKGAIARYALTGLMTLVTVIFFVIAATFIQGLIGSPGQPS